MRLKVKLLLAGFGLFCSALLAQHAVEPSQRYFRLICLVHLTGSGKKGDAVRPEYVPVEPPNRNGIIAWSSQLTDNGKMAIVQYVAVDHSAFNAILADKRSELRVFEVGKTPPAAIEGALRQFKHDFSLASFVVLAQ
jgi:hypothetical protein